MTPPVAAPELTVIIACYNAQEHVAAAVRSALEQDPPAAGVVVCDDASSDGSAHVLRSFGDRIQVVRHQDNRGEAAAKNTAVRAATTPFVVFLDADDVFLPGRIGALRAALLDDPDIDIATTDAYVVQDGEVLGRWYGPTNPLPTSDVRRAVLSYNPVFGHAAVRRSAFADAHGFDESIRYATDWDLWLRMILAGKRLCVIPEPMSLYRMHGGNLSGNRAAMLSSATGLLSRLRSTAQLSPEERDILEATIAEHERVLAREVLKAALSDGDPSARRLAIRVLRDGAQPRRSRFLATGVAIWPRTAARTWRHVRSGTWTGPGGRRLRLPDPGR